MRTVVVGVIAAMTALYFAAFAYFSVPGGASFPASCSFCGSCREMLPPDPGGHLVTYLNALRETLAIALLGTLLGAVLALPLGVLAARNVIPVALFRLPIKRFLTPCAGSTR